MLAGGKDEASNSLNERIAGVNSEEGRDERSETVTRDVMREARHASREGTV